MREDEQLKKILQLIERKDCPKTFVRLFQHINFTDELVKDLLLRVFKHFRLETFKVMLSNAVDLGGSQVTVIPNKSRHMKLLLWLASDEHFYTNFIAFAKKNKVGCFPLIHALLTCEHETVQHILDLYCDTFNIYDLKPEQLSLLECFYIDPATKIIHQTLVDESKDRTLEEEYFESGIIDFMVHCAKEFKLPAIVIKPDRKKTNEVEIKEFLKTLNIKSSEQTIFVDVSGYLPQRSYAMCIAKLTNGKIKLLENKKELDSYKQSTDSSQMTIEEIKFMIELGDYPAAINELSQHVCFTSGIAIDLFSHAFKNYRVKVIQMMLSNHEEHDRINSQKVMPEEIHKEFFKELYTGESIHKDLRELSGKNIIASFPLIRALLICWRLQLKPHKDYKNPFNIYDLTDYEISLLHSISISGTTLWQISGTYGQRSASSNENKSIYSNTSDLVLFMVQLAITFRLDTMVLKIFDTVSTNAKYAGAHKSRSGFIYPQDKPEVNTPTRLIRWLLKSISNSGVKTVYLSGIRPYELEVVTDALEAIEKEGFSIEVKVGTPEISQDNGEPNDPPTLEECRKSAHLSKPKFDSKEAVDGLFQGHLSMFERINGESSDAYKKVITDFAHQLVPEKGSSIALNYMVNPIADLYASKKTNQDDFKRKWKEFFKYIYSSELKEFLLASNAMEKLGEIPKGKIFNQFKILTPAELEELLSDVQEQLVSKNASNPASASVSAPKAAEVAASGDASASGASSDDDGLKAYILLTLLGRRYGDGSSSGCGSDLGDAKGPKGPKL